MSKIFKKKRIDLSDEEIHLLTTTLRLAGARSKHMQSKAQRKVRPAYRKKMDKLLDKLLKVDDYYAKE